VPSWRNATGQALSSPQWLEVHHRAKLQERTRFARTIASYKPERILDLGCATGLWLDLIDKVASPECEFVGVDKDPESLEIARARSQDWQRHSTFVRCDIASEWQQTPTADLTLAFNVFSYLPDLPAFFDSFRQRRKQLDRLVIRQYDGGTMRIGPMSSEDRYMIDASLRASLDASAEFSHYDLDRTYQALCESGLVRELLEFELTQRHAPFPPEFVDYLDGTVDWMRDHLSDEARTRLDAVLAEQTDNPRGLYFEQVDLVAVLTSPA
jgi:SAM-dependent methyltransferase